MIEGTSAVMCLSISIASTFVILYCGLNMIVHIILLHESQGQMSLLVPVLVMLFNIGKASLAPSQVNAEEKLSISEHKVGLVVF